MVFLSCCSGKQAYDGTYEKAKKVSGASEHFTGKSEREGKKAREFAITAVALAMLTLLAFGSAYVLFGIGTMPETMTVGFGIVPSLLGAFLTYLGTGVGITAAGFGVLAGYRACRSYKALQLNRKLEKQSSFVVL